MPDTNAYTKLLRIGIVADAFGVTPETVRVWAKDGKLSEIRTPGNQRRFRESEVRALLEQQGLNERAS
jgi:excisionase family DNA binding protein